MKLKKNILIICTVILCSFMAVGCGDTKTNKEVKSENNYALEIKNGARFFKSEIAPRSDSEKVILDCLKIEINDEYDKFRDVFIDSDRFNYYPEAHKRSFSEGLYTEEITVHSLNKLKEEEYSSDPKEIKFCPYMDKLKEHNPSEFEIIEVNYTNKLTDKYNEIAQWGSGNWTRYFVVVKEKKDSSWKLFDVYGHM